MIPAGFGRLTDPPASLLLAGVRVVDPSDGSDAVRDLGVREGVIVDAAEVPAGAPRIDGHGLVAAPGLCDLHAHLREPGDPATETVASGSRAAARGGFTTVCAMPDTDPPIDSPDAVTALVERASDASCRVRPIGSVSVGRTGRELADLGGMAAAGAVGFSNDGAAGDSETVARAALRVACELGLPLIEHAEDREPGGGGTVRAGPVAVSLGLPGWAAEAETGLVERGVELARETGAPVHLTHLSCAASVELVRRSRTDGVQVTCDVTPHHLALAETWVAGDRRFAWEAPGPIDAALAFDGSCGVSPPLTTREDAAALLAAVADGTIDAIATDHAPHPPERTLVPFDEAAPGMVGLETALALGLEAVAAGRLGLPALLAALSTRPARIIGETRGLAIGSLADLVLFDPAARWRVDGASLASASRNTPLIGMELRGVVRLTMAEGRVTYRS